MDPSPKIRGEGGSADRSNPFAFIPANLAKLMDPKSITALEELGGLPGLEKGLRTDRRAGLSVDETIFVDSITSHEAAAQALRRKDRVSSVESTDASHGSPLSKAGSHPLPLLTHRDDRYADRKRVFGEHRLPDRTSRSFLQLMWIALQDRVLILLSIAAAVSLALGLYQTFGQHHGDGARVEWIEGVAIIVAIAIVVIVGSVNDWQKERQFRKLNQKKEDRSVKVYRSGKPVKISIHDILVGDVMILEQGDVLPVDGVLIDGHTVSCDESSATGESDLVKKTPADAVSRAVKDGTSNTAKLDPFLLSGAKVLDGVGTFLVTAVGQHSLHGRTMMALRDDPGLTPLQAKLNILAGYIGKLGIASGLFLFTVLFIEFLARLGSSGTTPAEKGQSFLRIVIVSITIIVVAVPEGLPLAVTLSLAFATKKMTKENNLVRHLQSCETMGNATVVCTDKTGTLTENVMTVVGGSLGPGGVEFGVQAKVEACDDREKHESTGSQASTVRHFPISAFSASLGQEFRELVKDSIAVNTTAFESEEKGKAVFIGTKTETALLDWARSSFALGPLAIERANHTLVQLFPFNSSQKVMGSVVKLPNGRFRLLIKGAPEVVLARCSSAILDPTMELSQIKIGDNERTRIGKKILGYASLSLRTLALAYRDFESWPPTSFLSPDLKESGAGKREAKLADVLAEMIWIAVVAIQDPVRKGVPLAVATCHRAHVDVKVVTGDNVETARAIARECGIISNKNDLIMEGTEFRRLGEEERRIAARNLRVLARSSPEDKRLLVKALRSEGAVVAVTGDGTNDAPALKAADVGFSMGITGTEVAIEASDIVLMDDNFSSIVKSLAWGRAINDAVKKFLQFQITVNITAVILTFISAVASSEERSVLTAIQLLWVNLIMDTFAALALATDPPNDSLFDREPEPRTAPLISLTMWKMIIGQAIYQLVVTLILHFAGPSFLGYPDGQQRTLVFNVFVFMQIFKLVNSRRIDNKLNIFEGLHKNGLFMLMMAIMVAGQIIIIFFGSIAFHVERLNGVQWAISIVLGFLSIPVGIIIRLVPDRWAYRAVSWIPVVAWMRKWRARRKKDTEADVEMKAGAFEAAFLNVKNDLTFLKKVRGGRLRALRWSIGDKERPPSSASMSPIRSAVGMPGLLAASISGVPALEKKSSEQPQPQQGGGSEANAGGS